MNEDHFRTDLDPLLQLLVNIKHAEAWLAIHYNRILEPVGLTEPQYQVLRILAESDAISQAEIQSQMANPSSNVGRIIDKLTEKDICTRTINPSNRRKMNIALTPYGRRLEQQASHTVSAFHSELQQRLSPQNLQNLADSLRILCQE
jgi:DNA-binding MarR family transcriptional regulator